VVEGMAAMALVVVGMDSCIAVVEVVVLECMVEDRKFAVVVAVAVGSKL